MRLPAIIVPLALCLWPWSSSAQTLDMSEMPDDDSELELFKLDEEVMVFAVSRREETVDLAPSVVTVFTADQIERLGIKRIHDLLKLVPGFNASRHFMIEDAVGVGGFGSWLNEKLALMIDGHNVSQSAWMGIMLGELTELNTLNKIERIEIVHGPGAIMWGNNAMLAVLNIVTKNPGAGAGANLVVGTADPFSSQSTLNGLVNVTYGEQLTPRAGMFMSLTATRWEGWRSANMNYWISNGAFSAPARMDQWGAHKPAFELFAKANFDKVDMWFRFFDQHNFNPVLQQNAANSATLDLLARNNEFDLATMVYSAGVNAKLEPAKDLSMKVSLGYDRYNSFDRGESGRFSTDDIGSYKFMQTTMNANADFALTRFDQHEILFGAELLYQNFDPSDYLHLDPTDPKRIDLDNLETINYGVVDQWRPGHDLTVALYAQDTWRPLSFLSVIAGSRIETNAPRDNPSFRLNGKYILAPRGSVILHNADSTLIFKALYSAAYHRATWLQAFFSPGLFGSYSSARDNEYLHDGRVQGIWKVAGKLHLNASFFIQHVENMVLGVNLQNGTFGFANAGTWDGNGIEIEAKTFNLLPDTMFLVNGTFILRNSVRVRTDLNGQPLADPGQFNDQNGSGRFLGQPQIQANLIAEKTLYQKFYGSLQLRYLSRIPGKLINANNPIYGLAPGETREIMVNNQLYVDVSLGARDLLEDHLRVNLRVTNLLNNRARVPFIADLNDYQPAPRAVEVNLQGKF
jgi:outer membrane receptor protein involved in Fe transport